MRDNQKNSRPQHEYAKIGRVLENTHPEIVQGLVKLMTPELKDTSDISKMYIKYCLNHSPKDDFIHKITFIASILKLYCPSALLLSDCRVTNRVCIILTQVMGYNFRQSVSYYISQTRAYIKNNKFKDEVELISAEFKSISSELKEVA